jgi:hypothetical protein
MAEDKGKTPRRKKTERRKTGTAGQAGGTKTLASHTLPPDPQSIGRPMTEDEKVDEASLESMDGTWLATPMPQTIWFKSACCAPLLASTLGSPGPIFEPGC